MLNGRLAHDAARVGELELLYPLPAGKKANLDEAIRPVYLEILTRKPSPDEAAEAAALVPQSPNLLEGMADFRWVLLNSNEFRFLPCKSTGPTSTPARCGS